MPRDRRSWAFSLPPRRPIFPFSGVGAEEGASAFLREETASQYRTFPFMSFYGDLWHAQSPARLAFSLAARKSSIAPTTPGASGRFALE